MLYLGILIFFLVAAFIWMRCVNEEPPQRHKGIVNWYSARKGYGFISPAEGGKDIFVWEPEVHSANLSTLKAGQEITYYIGGRGMNMAVGLQIV